MEEIKIKKKIITNYLVITFLFSYGLWGIVIVANMFGYLKFGNPLCMTLFFLGAFGPTISSYFVQKKFGRITGFKDFIKKTFHFKDSPLSYGLVIFFVVLYFMYPALRGDISLEIPIWQAILLIPFMLIGGGLEEVGWRGVLQPELEKILPFSIATVITSVIWTMWHIPLFFIDGSSQSYVDFRAFSILLIGLSFAQAIIYRYSKNVWLCVLFHCSLNALPATFAFKEGIKTNTGIAIVMVVGALFTLIIWKILFRKSMKKSIV